MMCNADAIVSERPTAGSGLDAHRVRGRAELGFNYWHIEISLLLGPWGTVFDAEKATGIPRMATTNPARHPKVVAFRLESVVAFDWNGWSPSTGICDRNMQVRV
jgi:hypothetical protein